ncbi:MAG: hypothetical protein UV73_C0012G0072 [Candidatus Gottesmanbacteria bacterium GW2011_GWA2_43_14]|uniref:Succinylglutamate desuccinylase/Aspartoacylase catalytic domain-containing protein n=1 Tax=Candidatus Gottesmanbacteria bacterium GW2011_GWA2_43_14 TaxID=1618443 RepID=A0A0G1DEJ2_9BACT|nr:MAG: hypothetical protein UV73_C0012G0072 [Candidatus Gottesmanbacteria bacterium GW2011_GWA2_43_14]
MLRAVYKNLRLFWKYHLTGYPGKGPEEETELGIYYLDFNLDEYYRKILSFKKLYAISKIAEITYRDKKYPILKINFKGIKTNKKLLVIAGIHGNEQAAMMAIPEILKELRSRFSRYREMEIRIITPANPVGATCKSRYNAEGLDINRDFVIFRSREAALIKKEVEKFRPDFVLSLHESPQKQGMFFYANKFVPQETAVRIIKFLKENKFSLTETDYYGRKLKIAGYSPLGFGFAILNRLWKKFIKAQTMGAYLSSIKIPVITVETPWRSSNKEERISGHLAVFKQLTDSMLRQSGRRKVDEIPRIGKAQSTQAP